MNSSPLLFTNRWPTVHEAATIVNACTPSDTNRIPLVANETEMVEPNIFGKMEFLPDFGNFSWNFFRLILAKLFFSPILARFSAKISSETLYYVEEFLICLQPQAFLLEETVLGIKRRPPTSSLVCHRHALVAQIFRSFRNGQHFCPPHDDLRKLIGWN